ncbi:MAG: DUF4231 domain-containing protein, partial [Planctomycetota bacterium]
FRPEDSFGKEDDLIRQKTVYFRSTKMSERERYRKRPKFHVTAVQLDLECDGFGYQKWGDMQTCKPGDWLVNNNGDVYTIDKEYFRDYYRRVSPGVFEKIGEIWAEVAMDSGSIKTKEGSTAHSAGDYLVFDRQEGGEGYAIKKHIFERMYEQIDEERELTTQQQSYLDTRVNPKIAEYIAKAKWNRFHFHIWQMLAIIAAALVPVFAGSVTGEATRLKWLVASLGGASAVIAGLLSLFKFQENWIRYRSTHQDLESHISQFNVGAGIYWDKKNAFTLLVENCERILNAERGQWAEKSSRQDKQNEEDEVTQ